MRGITRYNGPIDISCLPDVRGGRLRRHHRCPIQIVAIATTYRGAIKRARARALPFTFIGRFYSDCNSGIIDRRHREIHKPAQAVRLTGLCAPVLSLYRSAPG